MKTASRDARRSPSDVFSPKKGAHFFFRRIQTVSLRGVSFYLIVNVSSAIIFFDFRAEMDGRIWWHALSLSLSLLTGLPHLGVPPVATALLAGGSLVALIAHWRSVGLMRWPELLPRWLAWLFAGLSVAQLYACAAFPTDVVRLTCGLSSFLSVFALCYRVDVGTRGRSNRHKESMNSVSWLAAHSLFMCIATGAITGSYALDASALMLLVVGIILLRVLLLYLL